MKINFLIPVIFLLLSCTNQKKDKKFSVKPNVENDLSDKNPPKKSSKNISQNFLFAVEGNYKTEESASDCPMQLTLTQKNNHFKYQLKTSTRNLSGDAEIELNEEKDGYYLTLKNIEWSEYEGEIKMDENAEQIDEDLALPVDVQGILYENEFTIQNGGNAMNYYVKIGECGEKFIRMIKD